VTGHLIGRVLSEAAHGRFPEPDGSVEIVPLWQPGVEGVVSLTGRAYIATTLPREAVLAHDLDGYGRAVDPSFICWLAGPAGWADCLDVVLTAFGTGVGGPPPLPAMADHPRVAHARLIRDDVEVFGDDRGLITLGTGIGGLAELGIESLAGHGGGAGRSLIRDSLGLVAAGEPVLASVAPGNARALRAFLAAGFTPVGSVQVVRPAGR
jgi:hypothetical protein